MPDRLWVSQFAASTTATFTYAVGVGAVSGGVATGSTKGALWGAFSAAMFFGVGQAFPGGQFGDKLYLQKVGMHALSGGVMSSLQGGKFGHGFLSAGVGAASGPWIDTSFGSPGGRVAAAAVVGGSVSVATGGKFANGAVTAAFSRAFNDEQRHSKVKAYSARTKQALSTIADKDNGRSVLSDIEGEDTIVAVSISENPSLQSPGQTRLVELTSRRSLWDVLVGTPPVERYAFEIQLNPDFEQRHFTDVNGKPFLPDTTRLLAHELGHVHAFAKGGYPGFVTDQRHSVTIENSIYSEISPGAPIRHPTMGHGRGF